MPENKETLIPPIERTETSTRMVDLQSERIVNVPAEVKTWMRKIEEDPTISKNNSQQPKGDDDSIMQPIATTVTKITLPGAIFLAIIAILPTILMKLGVTTGLASFFGGTSLLIIVGVALDTLQQIESHLLMRHYDGFMKSGKLKSRR